MNILLYLFLFMGATILGHLIYSERKARVKSVRSGNTFRIFYDNRTIEVILDPKIRIPSYSWVGKAERIVVPKIYGNVKQIELFMTRYKTSMLADALFRFSERNSMAIVRLDPVNAKKLIDIQLRLKCFIKNS